MKNILKKTAIILGVYLVFTFYLFLACNRIERLDEMDDIEKTGVALNIGD